MFSSFPSVASEPNLKKGRGTETSWAQKAAIMEWLELAPGDNFRLITGAEFLILNGIMFNFRLITGSATSKLIGVVAGAKVSKQSAYVGLADFVNQRCGTNWDPKTSMNRYKAFVKIFTDTRKAYNNVNGAKYLLGEDDMKKGITTIQQKLNSNCYGYQRIDVFFGERQNVTHSCIMMTGAPVVLSNIDRDGIILVENGAFLHADCDEYEYEVEVQDGGDDNEESSSDDESFIADEPIISEASTLTEEAPFLAPPARTHISSSSSTGTASSRKTSSAATFRAPSSSSSSSSSSNFSSSSSSSAGTLSSSSSSSSSSSNQGKKREEGCCQCNPSRSG